MTAIFFLRSSSFSLTVLFVISQADAVTMLTLLLSAQALLLPPISQPPVALEQSMTQQQPMLVAQQSNLFPGGTTTLLARGGRANMPLGEVYAGEAKDLDLSSFIDSVPTGKGAKPSAAKEKEEVKVSTLSPAEKQKLKQAEFAAKQAAAAENGLSLPSISIPKLPF